MKLPPLFPLFPIFLLSAVPLLRAKDRENPAPARPGGMDLRITAFDVPGMAPPLSLLEDPVSGDAALFLRLAGMVADGTAELAADQRSGVPAAREVSVEALRIMPFPTDWAPLPNPREMLPKEFEAKNGGFSTRAQLDFLPGEPPDSAAAAGIFGSLSVQGIRLDQLSPVPVSLPGVPEGGALNHPAFLTDSTDAVFHAEDPGPHLISVCRLAGETVTGNSDTAWRFTFAKASPQNRSRGQGQGQSRNSGPGSGGKTSGSGTALRLHALTFRLPVEEGREFLKLHAAGDDAGLLEALLQAGAGKKAELTRFAALRVETAARPPASGKTPEAGGGAGGMAVSAAPDPSVPPSAPGSIPDIGSPVITVSNSSSLTSSVDAIEEFPFATEHTDGLLPESFELKNLGFSFHTSVVRPMDASGGARVRVTLQHLPAPEMVSWPGPGEAGEEWRTYCPSFSLTGLLATVTARPGGVSFLGAITLPEYFKDQRAELPLMEISLLKAAGTGPGNGGGAAGNSFAGTEPEQARVPGLEPKSEREPELETEVFSLNAADAARLEALRHSPEEAAALLAELTATGDARRLAFCLVPGDERSGPEIQAMVETAVPAGAVWTATGKLLAAEVEFYNVGFGMKTGEGPPPERKRFLNFQHFASTMVQPSVEELKKAAAGNGKLAPHERFVMEGNVSFSDEPFRILSLGPAHVPPGHPEEGRRHAAVLHCRGR